MSITKISRDKSLINKIVFVDGLPGNGKTLFSSIIPSFTNVELLSYSDEIEAVCEYYYLDQISMNVAVPLLRMLADLKLYNQYMGRNVNFRPTDLSSAFNYPNKKEYINRLLMPGDEHIVPLINEKKPILHLATHNKLGFSEPIWEAFKNKIFFLEILRHPAYMIRQIASVLMDDLVDNVRNWSTQFLYEDKEIPYFSYGWEKDFLLLNPTERAVKFIDFYTEKVDKFKNENSYLLDKILTIPFEPFVLSPDVYIKKILNHLDIDLTEFSKDIFESQKIPRDKVADGIDLEIYRRCGWTKPIESLTESEELQIRKESVKNLVSKDIFELFINVCQVYEKMHWMPKEIN